MPQMEQLVAQTILQGFDAQYGRFLEITAGAQQRFEQANWGEIQQAMKKRIHLYDYHVGLVVEQLNRMVGGLFQDDAFLVRTKEIYTTLLPDYPRFEIAESFFNSVYCRLFQHRDLTPDKLFIFSSQHQRHFYEAPRPLTTNFSLLSGVKERLHVILTNTSLRLAWENLDRDINFIYQHLVERFGGEILAESTLQIYNELFYRNKTAWLVGKLQLKEGEVYPFLLPIYLSRAGKLYVDTCLTEFVEVSVVFSFSRAYFMVYIPQPFALVEWLKEILPSKTVADLYTAIGCQKHGKTEYYREYLNYISNSTEQFILAPGIKGMVMLVFTLPSYDHVFKVIKDRFAPQKAVSEERVRDCYQLVKEHDRVGRMADTQEYKNFVVEKSRLSAELLAELWREVPKKLEDLGDYIMIRHLYIERRMIPLNIYMQQANEQQLHHAIEEYGNAIKQLAAANIFPGDMLLKNFGVTRNGRVVFYDYDEICYMTEVNFRDIPLPSTYEEEMAAEPWYSVAQNDVFPEEFRHFLCCESHAQILFDKMHGDLFTSQYWRNLQQRIQAGIFEDVFAYHQAQRFIQRID